jgi:D-alanyl-D-alanine carboxypeptidase/D-alanyl-D-alanine-endopeptidase (penicillin-binding protein 4)
MQKKISYFILFTLLISPLSYAENTLQKFSALENAGLLLLDKQGQPVFSKKINTPFIPASTTKLVTAWLALKKWGEDYHFKTRFYLDSSTQTLWVKGSGDPFLVSEEIQLIAKNLKKLGIKQVKNITLDNSLFQTDLRLPGTGKTNNPYDAVPSSIAANFNTVYVKKIKGHLVSAEQETPLTPYAKQLANHLKKGSLRINTGRNPVNAEIYFAELLATFLRQQGVKVGADIVHGQLDKQVLFYTHQNSKSLAQMIKAMMKYSTNFLANQLILVLSAEAYLRPANAIDVQKYMESTLSKQFKWKNFAMKDGAGLSRENRLSPVQLVDLLQAFKEWKHLLPEIETGIFAKSGTMNRISTLAGYIVEDNQWQPFAIMMNQAVPYKFRNRIAVALANKPSVFPYHSYPGTNRATRADIRSARDFPVIIAF